MVHPITLFTAIYEMLMLSYSVCVAENESIPAILIEACIPYINITDTTIHIGDVDVNVTATESDDFVDSDDVLYDYVWTVHADTKQLWSFDPYEDENSWEFLMQVVSRFTESQLETTVIKNMHEQLVEACAIKTLSSEWKSTFKEMQAYIEKYAPNMLC